MDVKRKKHEKSDRKFTVTSLLVQPNSAAEEPVSVRPFFDLFQSSRGAPSALNSACNDTINVKYNLQRLPPSVAFPANSIDVISIRRRLTGTLTKFYFRFRLDVDEPQIYRLDYTRTRVMRSYVGLPPRLGSTR